MAKKTQQRKNKRKRKRTGRENDLLSRIAAFKEDQAEAYAAAEKEFARLQPDLAVAQKIASARDRGLYIEEIQTTYPEIDRLYEMAKRDQWNATADLHTSLPSDWDDVKAFPVRERVAGARVLSDFYWGEQGAQIVSAQLVSMVTDNEARHFLSTQTMDEARHVEVFQRMLQQLDRVYPMNPYLRLLLNDIYESRWTLEKLMGMNLFVEGLALSAFHEALNLHKSKTLDDTLKYVLKDEARHVGFGVKYLSKKLKGLNPVQKTRLKGKQLFWAVLLERSVRSHEREALTFGVDLVSVVKQILQDHQERIQEMAADALINTKPLEKLFDLIFPGSVRSPEI